VYCVLGPGWIAPLTKDMRAFAERPRFLRIEGRLYAGGGACQIFSKEGKYYLLAANDWDGVIEHVADKLYGPYGNARIAFAQARHATFFQMADGSPHFVQCGRERVP